jgi:hypothetical protein
MPDSMVNFARSTILTPPSPANSGTDFYIVSGPPSPTAPYDLTVWQSGNPLYNTAEIIRVLEQTGNHVTSCLRTQYGSVNLDITAGFQCEQGVTAQLLSQLGGGSSPYVQSGVGDPIDTNPTVPYAQGATYQDIASTGSTGLWISFDGIHWVAAAGTSVEFQGSGLTTFGPYGNNSYNQQDPTFGYTSMALGILGFGPAEQLQLFSGSLQTWMALDRGGLHLFFASQDIAFQTSNDDPNTDLGIFPGATGDVVFGGGATPGIYQATVAGAYASLTAGSPPSLPITVVTGVNDTLTLTTLDGDEIFTVLPGTYSTLADLEVALNNAEGNSEGEALSTWGGQPNGPPGFVSDNGTELVFTSGVPAITNASTITPGPTDITASIGLANPSTFSGAVPTVWAKIGGVLPTSDPHIANSLWSNLGIVTVSAG